MVAAIELISPSNKDCPSEREAFVAKCVGYLKDGISLLIVDLVTIRKQNLHHAIMLLLEKSDLSETGETASLYAVSYRPLRRVKEDAIEI